VAITVIPPTLDEPVLFSPKLTVKVPFPVPAMGVTLNQATFSETDHPVFEVTLKVVDPAGGATSRFAGATVRVAPAPAWLTVTTTLGSPVEETVI
jgi:hypothetical protein